MNRVLFCMTLMVLTLSGAGSLWAQQNPTQAQMETLQQLPPEEQERLLREMRSRSANQQDAPLAVPQTVLPRTAAPQPGSPKLDPVTGRPLIDPITGRPLLEPSPGRLIIDPITGRPMTDPETGQPLLEPMTRQVLIDPLTGMPLLDPETGEPLFVAPPETVPELPLFGYDLFAGVPTTFAPVSDIPIPMDYVVGPGDMVTVQLFGANPGTYTLVTNRDGAISFPELGPINVAGLTFDQMRHMLLERVAQQMIGVTASIGMGELRSIRIFMLGEVERPGSYTVSSLSTITNALFSSGGVRPIGSLRNVEHKRNGTLIGTLDLYDLLLRGDTRGDSRLQPGDVIFIPPVGQRVGIGGAVRRPAMYELKNERTASELLTLAGGLLPTAYPQRASVSRINERQERIQEDLDLQTSAGLNQALRAGDLVQVPSVLDRVDNVVTLEGHVWRPGPVAYRADMRLSDLIRTMDDLQPRADLNYVLIRREMSMGRRVIPLSADLEAALRDRGGPADVRLMPRDIVRVFDISPERSELTPLLDELRMQASLDQATPIVRIGGSVRAPGLYPLEAGMRISDLMRAGGALAERAYAIQAELTRYQVIDGAFREVALIEIDLAAIRQGDPGADIVLQPYDFLNVKEVTRWREQETVTLTGEVRFPGSFPIREGETLLSVIARAGGLTEQAFAGGAIFTRVTLREREAQQLRQFSEQLETDLVGLAIQSAQSPDAQSADDALAAGQGLLAQLRSATPVGRLALDLERILSVPPGSPADISLEDGDNLMIPGPIQTVTVIGEVHSPTSLVYEPNLSRDDYINLSGGVTRRADGGRAYIIRANGQVVATSGQRWFRTGRAEVMPGDTIVVPTDIERMRPIPLWTSVTQILFNLAVAVAAVNSF